MYTYHVDLQAQLSGLPPLVVPKRLVHRGQRKTGGGTGGEGDSEELNRTDQEKSVVKNTVKLLEV